VAALKCEDPSSNPSTTKKKKKNVFQS
jgi:hypothetical protein